MKVILGLLLGFASACAALAQDRMPVQLPALLDPSLRVDQDVKEECNLPVLVGERVFEQIKAVNAGAITATASSGTERSIRLRISAARMVPAVEIRRLTVASELVEGDRVLGTASFRSTSAAMPGYGLGLCDIMGNIATTIGKSVAHWARRSFAGEYTSK